MNFKWTIQKLVVAPQQADKANVVVQAEWLCTATDDVNKLQATASGKKNFSLGDSFTDFDALSESQVLDWCFVPETVTWTDFEGNKQSKNRLIKEEAEAQVSEQIARQLDRKISEPALPWAQIPA
jgi:hypothetical protein